MPLEQNGILRYGDMAILSFLEAKMVNLGPIDLQLGLPLSINENDRQNKF